MISHLLFSHGAHKNSHLRHLMLGGLIQNIYRLTSKQYIKDLHTEERVYILFCTADMVMSALCSLLCLWILNHKLHEPTQHHWVADAMQPLAQAYIRRIYRFGSYTLFQPILQHFRMTKEAISEKHCKTSMHMESILERALELMQLPGIYLINGYLILIRRLWI